MKIGIVTNLAGKGLQVDAELLQEFLIELEHEIQLVQFDQPWNGDHFDLGISLEVVAAHLFPIATRWWWIPNPEWTRPDSVRPAQKTFEKILAKTRDGEKALRELFSNVIYTGFLAKDKFDSSVIRESRCLHVGGDSGFKNTAEVISTWREYRYWDESPMPPLTVVSKSRTVERTDTPGITFHKQVTPEELKQLQNSHLFHIVPSAYEGYGHSLHEAQSVGAVILTTRAGPMRELHAPFEVPAISSKRNNLGVLYEVSPRDIRERVPEMLKQPSHEIARMSVEARLRFEQGNKAFRATFQGVLEASQRIQVASGTPVLQERPTIALYGNLIPEHSTENEWVRSFRKLGHQVLTFQENEDRVEDVTKTCIESGVKLFLFVHTHGYVSPGKLSLDEMLIKFKVANIKTVSPHLDLYFGLNENDGREARVGIHPFFHTDFVMTADGSSQDKFAERGVNHVWMRPGVLEDACTPGEYRKEFEGVQIGFTGARSYHPEYKFREELINTLEAVYGNTFRLFQGYRGQALNDLYASVPIWIGDCCFSGKPKYFSDRGVEAPGRGAFLLHPQVDGYCVPTATFRPQDIHDLLEKIDYFLENEEEREAIRRAAHLHVKHHDTYTHRAQFILKTVGL